MFRELTASDVPSPAATLNFVERLLRDVFGFADIAQIGTRVLKERQFTISQEAIGGRVPITVVPATVRAVSAGKAAERESLAARFAAIGAAGLLDAANEIEIARIATLTSITQNGADSLHRLVMDLHKALNRLAAECSEEILSGAQVFGLHPEDRTPVESFMKGLNETRALKFNHPGLDTTATHSNDRLLIQNDLGTADAHVVVIAVRRNSVTVTYTDVHRARAKFFVSLLDKFAAKWSGLDRHTAAGLGEDDAFLLVTGQ